MSKDIFETDKLQVTACLARNGIVQISLKGNHGYEKLTEEQVISLCSALLNRLNGTEGFRATD